MADDDFAKDLDRHVSKAHQALNRILAKPSVTPDMAAAVAFQVGCDCILSDAAECGAPGQHLLRTIKLLVEHAIETGWLPPQPTGATLVLVLGGGHDDEPKVMH
jgi:hypothetical protein